MRFQQGDDRSGSLPGADDSLIGGTSDWLRGGGSQGGLPNSGYVAEGRDHEVPSQVASPVVPTTDEIEGVARHLDRFLAIRPDPVKGSKIRKGVVGFLKSRTKSSEKLKIPRGHRRNRSSRSSEESPFGSAGTASSGDKEVHVSWESHVRSSSDDSPVAVVDGATLYLGASRSDEYKRRGNEAPLGSEVPLVKKGVDAGKVRDRDGVNDQSGGHVSQWAKKDLIEDAKSHRRQRSFELFSLPERRSRLKSVDSYFLPGSGKSKNSAFQAGRRRWSTEQRSWSFLQKIDLEGRYVDDSFPDEQISALSHMLMHNTNILELNLSWNMISDSGACSLAKFLAATKSLKKLDLGKNWKMGSEGGIALARALCENNSLEFLSLMNCKKVGTKAAEAFAAALTKNTGLTDLSLGDCRIGPLGASSIAGMLSLNCTLISINLSHNNIGIEGSRELAFSLKRNTSLRSMDIRACEIGDEGALFFGAALSYNSSLESLFLSRNKILNPGAAALASSLDGNKTLTQMDLSENYIGLGLLDEIGDRLRKNREQKLHVSPKDVQSVLEPNGCLNGVGFNVDKVQIPSMEAISDGRDIMRRTRTNSSAPLPIPFEYLNSCTDGFSDNRRLGQGAFGEVFLGIDKTLKRRFAVKRMKVVAFAGKDDAARARRIFRREIEAFKCFRHPNIARLHAFFISDNLQGPQCLVFDLAANGSLDNFLKSIASRRQLDWTRRLKIAAGIAKALKYLHQGDASYFGSCFHGDIKPHNVCLKKDFTPLLVDCGLSQVLPADDGEMTQSIYGSSCKGTRGTIGYICPTYAENFALGRSQSYTGACDIYSFGIVLVELFTGVLQRSRVDGEEFHIFDRFSEDGRLKKNLDADCDVHAGSWQLEYRRKFAGLATACIRKDPERRPSISDVEERLSSIYCSSKPWTQGQRNSLAFLFSNPLAWMDNEGSLHPVTRLATNIEMDLVQQCVRDSKRDIKLSFDAATCNRLQELVSARYGCLHFAGHGMPCSTLVFEDGHSGCEFVSAADLSALIPHREPFKFVFVAACHSEYIGEAFVNAGVKHVLCCEHESELLDDAAATFTRSFYGALCDGYTIKHAFEAGVGAVTIRHTVKESKKFVLLPERDDHDVPVFDAAELEWEEERTSQQHISTPVVFEGREVVMNQAISTILSRRRLVTLVGRSGVGRSSLALAIGGYIQDRLHGIRHIDNIIYVKRKEGVTDLDGALVRPLLEKMVSSGLVCEEKSLEACDLLQFMCRALKKAKALIIFDDFDCIDMEIAKCLLQALYENASNVQVLCVAQDPMNFISGAVIEKCIRVGPLDITSSAKLFGKTCPFADTGPKRERLSSGLLCREPSGGSTSPRKNSEEIVDIIHEGFPTEIIKAAKSVSEEDFHTLSLGDSRNS